MTGRGCVLRVVPVEPDVDDASPYGRVEERRADPREVLGAEEAEETQHALAGISIAEWRRLAVRYEPKIILVRPPHADVVNAIEARTQSLVDLVEVLCIHHDHR